LETDCRAAQESMGLCSIGVETLFLVFEYIFLVVITAELLAHVIVECRYVLTPWGLFDCLIVAVSMFNAISLQYVPLTNAEAVVLSKANGLRIFRLLRLSRSLVRVLRLPELWIMVMGLLSAMRAIAWIFVLGSLIVFVFAVFGVEVYSSLGQQWSRVGEAMMTLLQVATFDAWVSVMKPVTDEFPVLGHFFMFAYVALVGITLMALVTALLTERTLEQKRRSDHQEHEVSANAFAAELRTSQENMRKGLPSGSDITKEELENLWADAKVRSRLERFSSLEELAMVFDLLRASRAPLCTALQLEEFLMHAIQYKQDKEAMLGSLTLQHLLAMQRKLLSLEHRLEASQTQLIELSAGASRRCAELAGSLHDEQEAKKCKDDRLRTVKLCRLGAVSVDDVTQLRRVFELEDRAGRGELDFDTFKSFFPDASPDVVGKLWKDAAGQSGESICLEDFLRVVSRKSTKKLLRSSSDRQEIRSLCTPTDAGKEASALALRTAEEVVGRLAAERSAAERLAAERTAEHAAERAAARTADVMAESVAASVAERISQRILKTVSRHAAESAAAEAAAQFETLCTKVTMQFEGTFSELRTAWAQHSSTVAESAASAAAQKPVVSPQEFGDLMRAVQRPSRESASTQTEGLESARTEPPRAAVHTETEPARALSQEARSQQDISDQLIAAAAAGPGNMREDLHQGRHSSPINHVRIRPSPLQLDTPTWTGTPHAPPGSMFRQADMLRAAAMPNVPQEVHPLLAGPAVSAVSTQLPFQPVYCSPMHSSLMHSSFNADHPFSPSSRPCLMQQMESLAHQVSYLDFSQTEPRTGR